MARHSKSRPVTLKKKLIAMLVAMAVLASTFAPRVKAAASIDTYGYVEKTHYTPGEKGRLKLWVFNSGTETVTVESIKIEYPWHSLFIWEGNETINGIDKALLAGENWTTTRDFAVPSDGRALAIGSIRVRVYTKELPVDTLLVGIDLTDNAMASTLRSLEQISFLFTILVLIVFLGIFAVASTIFLSSRRAQVVWKTEEKPE